MTLDTGATEEAIRALEVKLAELEASLLNRDGIAIEQTPDALDAGRDFRERELVAGVLGNYSRTAKQVRRSLNAITSGEYGLCLQCGGEISRERLAAIPWAECCIECAGGNRESTVPKCLKIQTQSRIRARGEERPQAA